MFEKLEAIEKKYEELTKKISDPDVIANQNEWRQYMKEHAEIEPIVEKYREYKKTKQSMDEASEMLSDPELKELAEVEMKQHYLQILYLECIQCMQKESTGN